MAKGKSSKPLKRSAGRKHPGAVSLGAESARKRLIVTLMLEPEGVPHGHPTRAKEGRIEAEHPLNRPRLTRAELKRLHAPSKAQIRSVTEFAADSGLDFLGVSSIQPFFVLGGTVGSLNKAFGVNLLRYQFGGHSYLTHLQEIRLPGNLHASVDAVLGLDTSPLKRFGFPSLGSNPDNAHSLELLSKLYDFPETRGKGERIAVLSFGGGFYEDDMTAFFGRKGRIRTYSVLGAKNSPISRRSLKRFIKALEDPDRTYQSLLQPQGPYTLETLTACMQTIENTMDLQIAGGLAPGAALDVYFSPNNGQGFTMGILAALGVLPDHPDLIDYGRHGKKSHRRPNVISISWGEPETRHEPLLRSVGSALRLAKNMGVTVCCASGDFGTVNLPPGPQRSSIRRANVFFPASSPFALACGGTSLVYVREGVHHERVFNNPDYRGTSMATGGGISGFFERPRYQRRIRPRKPAKPLWVSKTIKDPESFKGRGVPDVAADADPGTGYRVLVGGRYTSVGGTSATTPLWAALIARLNEALGLHLGWVNPLLYQKKVAETFYVVETGDNDVTNGKLAFFHSKKGWDACTGLGSPYGKSLLKALQDLQSAESSKVERVGRLIE